MHLQSLKNKAENICITVMENKRFYEATHTDVTHQKPN